MCCMSNNYTSKLTDVLSKMDDTCKGAGVSFIRIRRVTGYLSPVTQFNNAKQAEEHDRVKHLM